MAEDEEVNEKHEPADTVLGLTILVVGFIAVFIVQNFVLVKLNVVVVDAGVETPPLSLLVVHLLVLLVAEVFLDLVVVPSDPCHDLAVVLDQ